MCSLGERDDAASLRVHRRLTNAASPFAQSWKPSHTAPVLSTTTATRVCLADAALSTLPAHWPPTDTIVYALSGEGQIAYGPGEMGEGGGEVPARSLCCARRFAETQHQPWRPCADPRPRRAPRGSSRGVCVLHSAMAASPPHLVLCRSTPGRTSWSGSLSAAGPRPSQKTSRSGAVLRERRVYAAAAMLGIHRCDSALGDAWTLAFLPATTFRSRRAF